MTSGLLQGALTSIADAGRELLYSGKKPLLARERKAPIPELCHSLLGQKGEALGTALAREILDRYRELNREQRRSFFASLRDQFEPASALLEEAIRAYLDHPCPAHRLSLERAAEAPRQQLLRKLNMAPGGTAILVGMREDLLPLVSDDASLEVVDADFVHLFSSWFNRGFLTLEQIAWETPAAVLEKLIAYEAVHEIRGWDDLRRRLEMDRRCYGFFHPALPGEPLIFVEVALTEGLSGSIQQLLQTSARDAAERGKRADTAIFYSISNCQEGLKGISFGSFLIKQVVSELQVELPGIRTFATLSPVPGFTHWLAVSGKLDEVSLDRLLEGHVEDADAATLMRLCAHYLAVERKGPMPLDPVARFHLGNGARLERINWMGDTSPRGMEQSFGIMANYLYDPRSIEANHEGLWREGRVVVGAQVKSLLKTKDTAKRG